MNEIFSTDPMSAGRQAAAFAMQHGGMAAIQKLVAEQTQVIIDARLEVQKRINIERDSRGDIRAAVASDFVPFNAALETLGGIALELANTCQKLSAKMADAKNIAAGTPGH